MNEQSSIWILLWSFVGAVSGGAVSAYLAGRFGEKGKIDATYAALMKVAKQVEVVTDKTETIKTQIAAGEWNRQWRLDRLTKVYGEVLEVVEKIITARTQLMGYSEQFEKADMKQMKLVLSGKCAGLSQNLISLDAEWRRISSQAMLFVDARTIELLVEFQKTYGAKSQDGRGDAPAIIAMQAAQRSLIEHGRTLLGSAALA